MRKLSCSEGTGKSPEEPGEPARRGSGLEDGCKMEFDEETDCKKKLEERKKSLRRQLRDIEKFASMDPVYRDRQEVWKEELEEIERKNTELLPEHQKVQKRSQKLQSLRDQKKKYLKDAGDCECECSMKKNEERQARFQARFQTLSEEPPQERSRL